MNQTSIASSAQAVSEENARFMAGVYKWMTAGILLTGIIAKLVATNEQLLFTIATTPLKWALIIGQLGCVFYLASRIQKMTAKIATIIFLAYAALTGLTLSSIFVIYTSASIEAAFFTTSVSFAGLSLYGYVTKRDLGPIGNFCMMGVWGMIAISLMSMFFPGMLGGTMGLIYSMAGVLIFAGLTAYDTQKIKEMNIIGNEGTEEDHKETIMGALTLYLDFINLFLMILRLMGSSRDD